MAEAAGSLDELHRCLDQLSGSNSGDAGTRARAALAAVRQELEALREVTAARWVPPMTLAGIRALCPGLAPHPRHTHTHLRVPLCTSQQRHIACMVW